MYEELLMSNLSNSQCLSLRLFSLISGSCLDGIRHWTRRKSRPRARIDAKRVVSLVKEEDNQKEAEERRGEEATPGHEEEKSLQGQLVSSIILIHVLRIL